MIYRFATMLLLGLMLSVIWLSHSPYLHDFGEWVYQSRILTLYWTQPAEVAGFQWTGYPVPNILAVVIMAVLGLFFSAFTAAKIFLTVLLTGWYFVLRKFVRQFGNTADQGMLLFLLYSLIGLSNFFWTGFVSYQLALLLLTLFLTRFKPTTPATELAVFAVLIFFSHALVFLVFVLMVLLETRNTSKPIRWLLALVPAATLSLWFVLGRHLSNYISPLADAAMAGWKEAVVYKLGYPLMTGPFKNLLQPDLSSLVDQLPWLYWAGFLVNVLVVSGVGIFILLAVLGQTRTSVINYKTQVTLSQQTLAIAAWVLLLFYVFAPYNFFGLINPSGRVTIPLFLVCLLLVSGTAQEAYLVKLFRVLTPITLVFTFITVFSYLVLMQRAGVPDYLTIGPAQNGKPPSASVLDYNSWLYSQARYKYFNYRIFGFSGRFQDIEQERYNRLAFRTALLVDYKDP